ncbi:small glutamine-rich tetratricopeptide repeat-containing protein 2 [Tanacetum coccineum]
MADATDSPTSLANRTIEEGAFYSDCKNVLAIDSYTNAINIIPYDHVYYLKRFAAQAALKDYKEAVNRLKATLGLARLITAYAYLKKCPISTYLHDKRFMQALGVMSNAVKIQDAYEELQDGEDILWMESKSLEFPTSTKGLAALTSKMTLTKKETNLHKCRL